MPKTTSEVKSPYKQLKCGFSGVGAGIISNDFDLLCTGSGQTVSQSNGNLVVAAGTAIGETVLLSKEAIEGSFTFRHKITLSQRIAGNNFFVELVDLVGKDLPYTILSSTSVRVDFPAATNPFKATNVGQSVTFAAIKGAGIGLAGRFVIASVAATSVTFTVVGWPASGEGTLTLIGWNQYSIRYLGTTATSVDLDASRQGWGGYASSTIASTTTGNVVVHLQSDGVQAGLGYGVTTSTAASPVATGSASRVDNLPDLDVPLYICIRIVNSTAPASTTTLTLGYVYAEELESKKVQIAGGTHGSEANALAVRFTSTPTVTATSGSHGSTAVSAGFQQIVEARLTMGTAVTDGQAVRARADKLGRTIVRQGQVRELTTNARITLTNTTETTLLTAVASTFNDLRKVSITNLSATATVITFRDTTGGTARWEINLAANQSVLFDWNGELKQTTVNTNWTCQLSVAANVNVTATFEQNL